MKEQGFGCAMLCIEGWDDITRTDSVIDGSVCADKRPSA